MRKSDVLTKKEIEETIQNMIAPLDKRVKALESSHMKKVGLYHVFYMHICNP
jgi:hypothetical protein